MLEPADILGNIKHLAAQIKIWGRERRQYHSTCTHAHTHRERERERERYMHWLTRTHTHTN